MAVRSHRLTTAHSSTDILPSIPGVKPCRHPLTSELQAFWEALKRKFITCDMAHMNVAELQSVGSFPLVFHTEIRLEKNVIALTTHPNWPRLGLHVHAILYGGNEDGLELAELTLTIQNPNCLAAQTLKAAVERNSQILEQKQNVDVNRKAVINATTTFIQRNRRLFVNAGLPVLVLPTFLKQEHLDEDVPLNEDALFHAVRGNGTIHVGFSQRVLDLR